MIYSFRKESNKLILFLIITIFFFSCFNHTSIEKKHLDSLCISFSFPIVYTDGELVNHTDSFYFFDNSEYSVYKLPIQTSVENDDKVLKIDVKYYYFCYKKLSSTGFLFDSLTSEIGKKVDTDSFLSEKVFGKFKPYNKKNDSLYKEFIIEGDIKFQKFLPKLKQDFTYADTTYFSSSDRFKNIDYSFSKELDSLNLLKVFKVRILYKAQYYKEFDFKYPERQFLFEMRENKIRNKEDIIYLIKKVESIYSKNL